MGCLTSMNICWDVRGRWLKILQPALAHTDFIFPNREEGRQLTGESEPAAIAARLRELGVKTLSSSWERRVAMWNRLRARSPSPGFAVQPVDTTGAGDCFAAGFLAAICRGQSLSLAARYANATGALATLGLGGADSAPTMPARGFSAQTFCFLTIPNPSLRRGAVERIGLGASAVVVGVKATGVGMVWAARRWLLTWYMHYELLP